MQISKFIDMEAFNMSINLDAFFGNESYKYNSTIEEDMLEGQVISLEGDVLFSQVSLLKDRSELFSKLTTYYKNHKSFDNLHEVIPVDSFISSTEDFDIQVSKGMESIGEGFSKAVDTIKKWWQKFIDWLKKTWTRIKQIFRIEADPIRPLREAIKQAAKGSRFEVAVPTITEGVDTLTGDAVFLSLKRNTETVCDQVKLLENVRTGIRQGKIDDPAGETGVNEQLCAHVIGNCDAIIKMLSTGAFEIVTLEEKDVLSLGSRIADASKVVNELVDVLGRTKAAAYPIAQIEIDPNNVTAPHLSTPAHICLQKLSVAVPEILSFTQLALKNINSPRVIAP